MERKLYGLNSPAIRALSSQAVVALRIGRVQTDDKLVEVIEKLRPGGNNLAVGGGGSNDPSPPHLRSELLEVWSKGWLPSEELKPYGSKGSQTMDDCPPLFRSHGLHLDFCTAAVDTPEVAGVEKVGFNLERVQFSKTVGHKAAGHFQVTETDHDPPPERPRT
ncbi:hypothetical protein AC481_00905 [miscellaneous Crenarchaeota group archaeon SMTZ-80]|nr:MAG: hypothetical protein AC481_00905 [miscellaneous Crenarchaeota group archaeon SMTZ-80]